MVVDGKLKASFDDEQVAQAAGVELLTKFPMLRVEVYNSPDSSWSDFGNTTVNNLRYSGARKRRERNADV